MRRIRRIAASAMGGFKINGPPKNGKGPMSQGNNLGTRDEASLPQPTQAGRIETCTELIRQAMRCLENNDKECIIKTLEELIKANCYNGNMVGNEIVSSVKDVVHKLWLSSGDELRCELLMRLVELRMSRNWVRDALGMNTKRLNKWLVRCNINGESRIVRNNIVEDIEDLLRDVLGWDEIRMCEELWKFVGIDVNEFRRHGIEPCIWLIGLEGLRSLKRPYWLGLRASDLAVRRREKGVELKLRTTNTIDAVFFPMLLNIVKIPRPEIEWGRIIPGTRHATKSIALSFYVDLGPNEWPWPINLNADEFERILNGFNDERLAMFVAGMIDGDGLVRCIFKDNNAYVQVGITACKKCHKSYILNVLRRVIAERFGIAGSIESQRAANVLVFSGEDAIRLLRRVTKYMHHPLKRLRAELILALYDERISLEVFGKLYEQTEYERRAPDVKRSHGLEALAQAAPQTHTNRDLGLALTLYYLHFAQYQSSRRSSFSSVVPTAFITTVNMAV